MSLSYEGEIVIPQADDSYGFVNIDLCNLQDTFVPGLNATGFTADHFPLGFAEWSAFFDKYVVLGSKVMVKFSPRQDDERVFRYGAFMQPQEDSLEVNTNNINLLRENRRGVHYEKASNNNRVTRAMAKYSPRKYFGIRFPRDNQNLEGSINTSNAAAQPQLNAICVCYAGASRTTSVGDSLIHVRLDVQFMVGLKSPRILPEIFS